MWDVTYKVNILICIIHADSSMRDRGHQGSHCCDKCSIVRGTIVNKTPHFQTVELQTTNQLPEFDIYLFSRVSSGGVRSWWQLEVAVKSSDHEHKSMCGILLLPRRCGERRCNINISITYKFFSILSLPSPLSHHRELLYGYHHTVIPSLRFLHVVDSCTALFVLSIVIQQRWVW